MGQRRDQKVILIEEFLCKIMKGANVEPAAHANEEIYI